MQRKQKLKQFVMDKGYYLALGVCVAAVAVSGWLFLRSLDVPDGEIAVPEVVEAAVVPTLPRNLTEEQRPAGNPGSALAGVRLPQETEAPSVPEAAPVTEPAPQTSAAPTAPGRLTCLPLEGETVTPCSLDKLAYNPTTRDWRTHEGMDLAAPEGTPVQAAGEGTVLSVYDDDLLGRTVTLEHGNGVVTIYANLAEEVPVSAGDHVGAGEVVGAVGRTALAELGDASHLHFAVTKNGIPTDPAELLP